MAKKAENIEAFASGSALAALFGCSERAVRALAADGVVKRVGRGQYDVRKSIKGYIAHLREQAAGRVGHDPAQDAVAANRERSLEQAALLRARRMQIEGRMVSADDVRETWGKITRHLRQFVLGLPGQIAFDVPTLTATDRQTIERLCRDGLEDAALGRGLTAGAEAQHNDAGAD